MQISAQMRGVLNLNGVCSVALTFEGTLSVGSPLMDPANGSDAVDRVVGEG